MSCMLCLQGAVGGPSGVSVSSGGFISTGVDALQPYGLWPCRGVNWNLWIHVTAGDQSMSNASVSLATEVLESYAGFVL